MAAMKAHSSIRNLPWRDEIGLAGFVNQFETSSMTLCTANFFQAHVDRIPKPKPKTQNSSPIIRMRGVHSEERYRGQVRNCRGGFTATGSPAGCARPRRL